MQIYCNDIINIVRRIYYSNNNHDDNEKKVTTHPPTHLVAAGCLLYSPMQNKTSRKASQLFYLHYCVDKKLINLRLLWKVADEISE